MSKESEWARAARLHAQLSGAELGRRLSESLGRSIDRAAVDKMQKGIRRIKADELYAISSVTGFPLPDELAASIRPATDGAGAILGAEHVPLKPVTVVGAVQAGVYVEALEWPPDEWYSAPVAALPQYAQFHQTGLAVRGDSMNELYPDGSVVICVKFIDLGRDPRDGERVIVQRRVGTEWEATVKELRQHADGSWWLWPRSSSPEFQQPWRLDHDGDDWNDNLQVVAKVIGCVRLEP